MLNNATCRTCGRTLELRGTSFICPYCNKVQERKSSSGGTVIGVVVMLSLMLIFGGIGLGGVSFGLLVVMVTRLAVKAVKALEESETEEHEAPLPTAATDYIAKFRRAADTNNPLAMFASEAASQLESMRQKQYALKMMLGTTDHPFYASSKEAEAYLLANSKKILFRLLYCDLSDPVVREQHAEYVRERLTENAVILHDFERLNIEVSQMDEESPVPAPRLDILADTLHDLHGGQDDLTDYGIMQDYSVPQPAVLRQQY